MNTQTNSANPTNAGVHRLHLHGEEVLTEELSRHLPISATAEEGTYAGEAGA